LSQEAYIGKILKHFNLQDAKAIQMPIDPNTKLTKDKSPETNEEKDHMEKVPYHQAVGSLMWAAMATRPDIAFTVSLLLQFMESPGKAHWEAIKRVFKYLKGMKNNELIIGKTKDSLIGYCNVTITIAVPRSYY
jgi:ATP-binding cassette subfamily B (MDR/TAP) protein 1